MAPSESNPVPLMEENYSNPNLQDQDQDQDHDEADETLSFCDLSIYSSEDQNFSSSSSTSSSSSSDQDFFEFFSEDWSPISSSYPHENIVFCGKLIPFREPICSPTAAASHKIDGKSEKTKKRGLFRWNSKWFGRQRSSNKAKNTKSRCTNKTNQPPKLLFSGSNPPPLPPTSGKCGYKAEKGGEKYSFPVRGVSVVKSRWQLLVFGLAGLPAEMEFSDLRSRQSRRSPSALFRPGSDDEKVGGGKGLWGLIRGLGCAGDGNHLQNSVVVKAQFGCIPGA